MPQQEMYFTETPWICITYLMSDDEADANGGQTKIALDCCICGERKEFTVAMPAKDDPVWRTVDPQKGLPEAYRIRCEFQRDHLHPGKHNSPMLQWAKPLRNVVAIGSGLKLEELRERLDRDIKGMAEQN